ncbi:NUDIX hydrolase [Thalassotalea crassostreae]|uniref:NUDIX hydrolase n=1 Tax=Thalassotalea crassostreae TaxID=1763536 RepID=UPI00083833ED|nr:NUDIX hydrolase [Thalassotalea crassostreae]
MRLLRSTRHPNITNQCDTSFHRQAARGIILNGEDILLLYTECYHDYSLPGGGVDESENFQQGLVRELIEETGAKNIRNIKPFGRYEEFRPWYKDDFDIMHMESFCYTCEIDDDLGPNKLEPHELENGMTPMWVNIYQAIRHNENTIANSDKKGMSIERETFLLKLIAKELIA